MAARYRVTSPRTGAALGDAIGLAASHWSRFRGLMLRGRLAPGEGLIITPCSSIHMMFMRIAIDAVFFDRDGRVTKVARRVRPWFGIAGKRGSAGVIELPVGAADGVEPGDQLHFDPPLAR